MKSPRRIKKMERLNLIPILDAIFIFIFFLLMSAQFIDIYEIGSDAPVTSTLNKEQEDKKKPLNLTLVIKKSYIEIRTGLDARVLKRVPLNQGNYDLVKIKEVLVELKRNNPKESTVILKPAKNVKYDKLVMIMDSVKDYKNPAAQNKRSDLFKKIVFETI